MATFAIIAALLTVLPGLDTVQVLRSATVSGPKTAYQTLFGIITGVYILAIAAATGISAVIISSGMAYHVLKIVGGLYLLYLGINMVLNAKLIGVTEEKYEFKGNVGFWKTYIRAITITVTNPKGLAFYIAVMPQFIPEESNAFLGALTLATIHNAEVLIWFSSVIWSTALAKNYLNKPSAKIAMERISGVAMIGFGISFLLNR
jgi:threonine/homoserine/homoserine lactone efflux protein